MASINMDSIMEKVKKITESAEFRKKIDEKVDSVMRLGGTVALNGKRATIAGAAAAAEKFIEVLQKEIQSHASMSASEGGLGETAIDALTKLEHSTPAKIGNNLYTVDIYFADNLNRKSLAPEKYAGVDNIAALLNSGYHAGHSVYGVWEGHGSERIRSLANRSGAHFVESAIRNFKTGYAAELGIIDITVDDIYL